MASVGFWPWVSFLLLSWTLLPLATSEGYHNLPDFMNPAYNPNYNPYPSTIDPAVFERCWVEATIPMAVALGDLSQWSYMCSSSYYRTCETTLPVALVTVAKLNPYQRDYVMENINAYVKGGAPYLCNIGQTAIRQLMEDGGRACLKQTAGKRVEKCNLQLATLRSGIEYSEVYCHDWDNDFMCYIDAVNTCPNDALANFLWDFFQNIMYYSPCQGVSIFTNAAQHQTVNHMVMATFTALSVLITLLGLRK